MGDGYKLDEDIGHKAWISYLDDENKIISGFIILLERTENYIKFKTNQNIITISYSRLIKLKERVE